MASVVHRETNALPSATAAACLAAGWRRLRRGGVLVLLLWLEILLVALSTLAGLALPLAAVDFAPLRAVASADRQAVLAGLVWLSEEADWRDLVPHSPLLITALGGLAVSWTAALFLYCWFQAGLYGVLAEPTTGSWRTELRRFAAHGRRHLWRFFGLLHAFGLYLLLLLAVWAVAISLVAAGVSAWADASGGEVSAVPALAGLGCAATLPILFLVAVLALWFLLARADLVRPGSGVRAAQRRGWELLRERPGTVAVLGLVFVVAGLVASEALSPLTWLVGRWWGSGSVGGWVVRGLIELASWGLYAAVAVWVAATTVALMVPAEPIGAGSGGEVRVA